MTITVNGKPEEIAGPLSLVSFLESKSVPASVVVVERNGSIVKREEFGAVTLAHGDTLEIVRFVGGG